MSDGSHNTGHKPDSEHGTLVSYVIGFILSLELTFMAYYFVVNETFSSSTLWLTILGLAMLQMIVQVLFFLHLGRGPKPRWNLYFYVATVFLVLVVVGGSVFIIDNLHYNMSPSDKIKKIANDEGIYQVGGKETGACQEIQDNHKITITGGQISPMQTEANKCDTLTFINETPNELVLHFGIYPQSAVYAGETEVAIRAGRSETLTLSEAGSYTFYDHADPNAYGQFTVLLDD